MTTARTAMPATTGDVTQLFGKDTLPSDAVTEEGDVSLNH